MINIIFLLGAINLHMLIGSGISENLPRPNLSLNPDVKVFLVGEKINLTCHCQAPVEMIRFHNSRIMFFEISVEKGFSMGHMILDADLGYENNYTCECWVLRYGQWEHSIKSDAVQICIRDKLLAPIISKHPSSTAISIGEMLNISCHVKIRSKAITFYLSRNNEEKTVQSVMTPGETKTVKFSTKIENKQDAGRYTCRYQTEVLGRTVNSPHSKALIITLKEERLGPDMNNDTESGPQKKFPLYAVLGSAALLIVVLVITTVFFLLIKRRKAKAQNIDRCEMSGSPMPNDGTGDPLYFDQITPPNPEENRLNSVAPENNSQDVTYASLNLEALRQKGGTCANSPDIKIPVKKNCVEVSNSDNGDVTYASVEVGKLK